MYHDVSSTGVKFNVLYMSIKSVIYAVQVFCPSFLILLSFTERGVLNLLT